MIQNQEELYDLVCGIKDYWPKYVTYNEVLKCFKIGGYGPLLDISICIFEATFTRLLLSEGFHSFEWDSNDEDTILSLYGKEYIGYSELECLVEAIKGLK